MKILLAFMKNVLNLKLVPKAVTEFLSGLLALSLVDFIQLPPLIGCRKNPPRGTCYNLLMEQFTAGFRGKFYSNSQLSYLNA
jgi:hypothetical protein